jgi:hypothetical protein
MPAVFRWLPPMVLPLVLSLVIDNRQRFGYTLICFKPNYPRIALTTIGFFGERS